MALLLGKADFVHCWRRVYSIGTTPSSFVSQSGLEGFNWNAHCGIMELELFWQGELIVDEHLLEVPTLPPGSYQLEIGLYGAEMRRLRLLTGEDAVRLLPFQWKQ